MGLVPNSALASLVVAEKRCLVEVPDKWTMEDAATVPFAYITALYALCVVRIGLHRNNESEFS